MFEISEEEIEDFLDHHGVKGQKWGVRRQQKKLAKADAKWEKNLNTAHTFIAVHNRAAELANTLDIDRINNSPRYKGKALLNDMNDPVTKQYIREHERAFNKRFDQAVQEIVGPNPSGTRKVHVNIDTGETSFEDISHAADEPASITVEFDSLHHIVRWVMTVNEMAQDALDIDDDELEDFIIVQDYLDHHGIKGQRWGVRRKSPHNDSFVPRMNPKQLSDAQLRSAVNRMNMEQQFSRLSKKPSKVKKGHDVVKGILAVGVTVNTAIAFAQTPAGRTVMKAIGNSLEKSKEALSAL